MSTPFHLAMPVHDVDAARRFYADVMGCTEGRRSERSVVFNFRGNQFVVHQVDDYQGAAAGRNPVDGEHVPVPHFGVVLGLDDWQALADQLSGKVDFVIAPTTRYAGTSGEQRTMFFLDPSGNALEIKGFADPETAMFSPWEQA